jgi:hypothetical protein
MKASLKLAASAFALALASTAASAQTVISRSINPEPVETTVTQTPAGTVVTRRPLAEQPAPFVAPQPGAPVFAQPTVPAATFVDTGPDTVDTFTTRQVVQRAAVETEARPMVTRQVSAPHHLAVQRKAVRHVSTSAHQRPVVSATAHQRPVVQQTTRVVRQTRQVSLTHPAARIVLNPRERQIVYRTIVEREVIPRQPVIVAPMAAPAPAYVAPQVVPPVVAADETVATAPITVGTVLPPNVPLFAIPQNVALTVPATQPYSYAWLGGRAYLVDPASGTVVSDLTD